MKQKRSVAYYPALAGETGEERDPQDVVKELAVKRFKVLGSEQKGDGVVFTIEFTKEPQLPAYMKWIGG